MIDALRFVKRPAPGAGWRAVALHVGPALLLAATVLPSLLLWDPMIRYLRQPDTPDQFRSPVMAFISGAGLVVGWLTVLTIHLSPGRPSRRDLWGLWLPLLYAAGGFAVACTVPDLVFLAEHPSRGTADGGGLAWWALNWAALAACASVGVVLGRRAAATEPAPRPASRAVWIAEVDAGLSWWMLQAVAALAAALLVSWPLLFVESLGAALQFAGGVAATVGLVAVWASRSVVTISPAGVRVGHGHIRLFGWELGIDSIASVEVADMRLLRSTAAWMNSWTNLVTRDGPALVVRTRWGKRRVLTVPDADDAAAVLGRWLEERREALG